MLITGKENIERYRLLVLKTKLQLEIETVEQRLDKKIKTINTLEDKVFGITKEIDVEFKKIELQIQSLGGHDITK